MQRIRWTGGTANVLMHQVLYRVVLERENGNLSLYWECGSESSAVFDWGKVFTKNDEGAQRIRLGASGVSNPYTYTFGYKLLRYPAGISQG